METIEQIQGRMMDNLPDKYSKLEDDFPYDFAKVTAIEFKNIEDKITETESKLSIENLKGTDLEQRVYEKTGIARKPSTFATGVVTITGVEGSIVNIGDLVSSDNLNYVVQETKTIGVTGTIGVSVKCEIDGSSGNVPVGAIKYFPITLQGLESVTNSVAITNGYDAETDGSLLQRYYDKIRTPATSSNISQYKNWAKEVVGVGDVKIIPLWNGDNTVKVVIIDSNKGVADSLLIEQVQNYIDPKGELVNLVYDKWGLGYGQAPIGAFTTVVSAIAKNVDMSVTIVKDNTRTNEEIKLDIENNIKTYFKEINFKTDVNGIPESLLYNKVSNIIFETSGVSDYSNLTINGLTSNITPSTEEIFVLGVVTIV